MDLYSTSSSPSLGVAMKPSASMVMRPTKATSNAARAAAVTSQMLRDYPVQQHREEAGGEEDEPKLDYLTAEDTKRAKQQGQAGRAREKAAEAAAERRASPMSKAQLRKLVQIEVKKQKAAAREEVMAVLAAHRSDDLSFIKSSSTLGVTPTKRQRLQRALQARAASVVLDEEADAALEQPRQARVWEEAAPAPAAAPSPRDEAASRAGKKGKAAAAGEKAVQEKKVAESEGQAGGQEKHGQTQERDDAWWAKQAVGFSTAARVLQPGSNREEEATDAAPEAKEGKKRSHPSRQTGPADPSDDPSPPAFTTRFGLVEARAAAAAAQEMTCAGISALDCECSKWVSNGNQKIEGVTDHSACVAQNGNWCSNRETKCDNRDKCSWDGSTYACATNKLYTVENCLQTLQTLQTKTQAPLWEKSGLDLKQCSAVLSSVEAVYVKSNKDHLTRMAGGLDKTNKMNDIWVSGSKAYECLMKKGVVGIGCSDSDCSRGSPLSCINPMKNSKASCCELHKIAT
mgnify:CR=1 FL=1